MRNVRTQAALAIALMLLLVACTDTLTQLSKALDDTAKGMSALQTGVIDANKQGLISDANTETILRLCAKIDQGGSQAVALTRNLGKLAPADRANVLIVLKPVIAAVDEAVASGLTGVTEPTKGKILALMQTIQTALNTAQVILASSGPVAPAPAGGK
jgi:hypothetical protein